MGKKIKVTQIKSVIGQKQRIKRTINALGLKRLHHSVVHDDAPQIRGMVNVVKHLIKFEEVD